MADQRTEHAPRPLGVLVGELELHVALGGHGQPGLWTLPSMFTSTSAGSRGSCASWPGPPGRRPAAWSPRGRPCSPLWPLPQGPASSRRHRVYPGRQGERQRGVVPDRDVLLAVQLARFFSSWRARNPYRPPGSDLLQQQKRPSLSVLPSWPLPLGRQHRDLGPLQRLALPQHAHGRVCRVSTGTISSGRRSHDSDSSLGDLPLSDRPTKVLGWYTSRNGSVPPRWVTPYLQVPATR